eukprot:2692105-Prymnesium_polylepis.1
MGRPCAPCLEWGLPYRTVRPYRTTLLILEYHVAVFTDAFSEIGLSFKQVVGLTGEVASAVRPPRPLCALAMCQGIVRPMEDDSEILIRHDDDRSSPRPVTANVISAERQEKTNTLMFTIKVSEHGDGYLGYSLVRKYEQFSALHSSLAAQPALSGRLPPLPPKPRRPSRQQQHDFDLTIIDRLGDYTRLLVSDSVLLASHDVRAFLELGAADQLAEKLREREAMFLQLIAEKDRAYEEQQRLLCSLQVGAARACPSRGAHAQRSPAGSFAPSAP